MVEPKLDTLAGRVLICSLPPSPSLFLPSLIPLIAHPTTVLALARLGPVFSVHPSPAYCHLFRIVLTVLPAMRAHSDPAHDLVPGFSVIWRLLWDTRYILAAGGMIALGAYYCLGLAEKNSRSIQSEFSSALSFDTLDH